MCVIAYKPTNVAFPEENILQNCYDNNPDGAGFMYAWNGKVYIQKGYETWEAFKGALDRARAKTGDKIPYVMHFRIATQGFERTMTHPFPLSSKMSRLKRLRTDCNIGVAHNGIIDLTSDGSKHYSDTMLFITDYLSLIIRNYSWYKDDRTKQLIENLIDTSRLAILDKNGHCELMGRGWVEDKGIHYSNNSYSYKKVAYNWDNWGIKQGNYVWDDDGYNFEFVNAVNKIKDDIHLEATKLDDNLKPHNTSGYIDPHGDKFNELTGEYDFEEEECPQIEEDDDSYCYACNKLGVCKYTKSAIGF